MYGSAGCMEVESSKVKDSVYFVGWFIKCQNYKHTEVCYSIFPDSFNVFLLFSLIISI